MIELHFNDDLYDGFAVDEAVKAYVEYASAELTRETGRYVVRVTALPAATEGGIDEATLAAELANFALGKTIERGAGGILAGPVE